MLQSGHNKRDFKGTWTQQQIDIDMAMRSAVSKLELNSWCETETNISGCKMAEE